MQKVIEDNRDLYKHGLLCAHSSGEDGIADVGLSVGLGDGRMLYVGDVAKASGVGIRVWDERQGKSIVVGEVKDFYAAKEMVEAVAAALARSRT